MVDTGLMKFIEGEIYKTMSLSRIELLTLFGFKKGNKPFAIYYAILNKNRFYKFVVRNISQILNITLL